jgi:hypothetical protein
MNIFYSQDIKWSQNHSGPRKRLKSNTVNMFQQVKIFSEFFNNPVIDKHLSKGKYQIFVKS